MDVLQQLPSRTGGKAYQALKRADFRSVLFDALSRRPCVHVQLLRGISGKGIQTDSALTRSRPRPCAEVAPPPPHGRTSACRFSRAFAGRNSQDPGDRTPPSTTPPRPSPSRRPCPRSCWSVPRGGAGRPEQADAAGVCAHPGRGPGRRGPAAAPAEPAGASRWRYDRRRRAPVC